MAVPAPHATLLVTLSGDVGTKSHRTRRRFRRRLMDNIEAALDARSVTHAADDTLGTGRLAYRTDDPDAAAPMIASVFGVHRVELARPIVWSDLEDLSQQVADRAAELVTDKRFAVRVRRTGEHDWSSMQAERAIGTLLDPLSAGVDLDDPEAEVRVLVLDEQAWLLERTWSGPAGLPLGTQEGVLSLLSGGFDSPVATWMLMRRGCPVEFFHVRLDCAQTEHALAVANDLARRWGAGTRPVAWVVDFEDVKESLLHDAPPRLRQVLLKQLMFAAADRIAEERGIAALVTGEAVGQVSSQTLHHLGQIDRFANRPVLRPLAGFDKDEIVAKAREVGTHDLSVRAREVCDLSGGNVAIAAQGETLDRAHDGLPEGLLERAMERLSVVALHRWVPGLDAVPVVDRPGEGYVTIGADDEVPETGPIAVVAGDDAIELATALAVGGREVQLVRPAPGPDLRAVG
ncbi:MAG: tRNA 4-thiouridine(8) synthase ThiI [Actinobacteria bacterium]|nr:tRNA 4-thiouridine(8) synthase ThiI [Actinomycetota bacterium]